MSTITAQFFGMPATPAAEDDHEGRVLAAAESERVKREARRRVDAEEQGGSGALTDDLAFLTFGELAAQVDAEGPRRYLFRGIFPAGDYGVLAAEAKAQKTWTACDAAVSAASHTPFLNRFAVDDPGPVLMFVGEGGRGNIVRRIRAVARSRGLVAENLPIVICVRAPHFTNAAHLRSMAAKIAILRPRLVIVDPFYLSARGADLKDLYAMGAVLETVQRLCQSVGAALLIVTHFNRGQGQGAGRITGAGPAEWGRVLITTTVRSRHKEPETKGTRVLTELEIVGGEIADQTVRVQRRIWADDPDDLNSPLHIELTVTDGAAESAGDESSTDSTADLSPAERKLLEALQAADEPLTSAALVDRVAQLHGHGLKRETASKALNQLERLGLAVPTDRGSFQPKLWALPPRDRQPAEDEASVTRETVTRENPNKTPCDPCDITRNGHAETASVMSCDHTLRVVHTRHTGAEDTDAGRY